MNNKSNKIIIFFIFIFSLFLTGFSYGQENKFHKDSLRSHSSPTIDKKIIKSTIAVLGGIVAGDYKKLGWNEYVPKDAMEFQDLPLPNINNYPRLITRSQIYDAKLKLNSYPFQEWYFQLMQIPNNINSTHFNPLYKISDRIKMIAFLYKIEGNLKYLDQIEKLLKQIPEPPLTTNLQGGIVGDGWGDYLESAQAIFSLCGALDLIWYDINKEIKEEILRKIFIRVNQILSSFAYTPANNHLLVMGISLIEIALLIDNPEKYIAYNRYQIWNAGWGHISRATAIIAPDGGYGEGVDYARFILSYLAPFSVHLYTNTGIKLFENPRLYRMLNWVMANDKGNGIYAKFDDALNNSAVVFPIVIPFSNNGALYNKYYKSIPEKRSYSPNLVEAICVYKDIPSFYINDPDNIQFYPDMGQAVFKDRFFKPEIFVSVLGERERWFADRHEHIEPLAIELSAFGDDIFVDPGYGKWTSDYNRTSWYTIPYAHNGILVDGLGTYRNPIWGDSIGSNMQHAYRTPNSASVTVSTKILDVTLQRKAYFFKNKYLFIIDKVNGNKNHTISQNYNHRGTIQQLSEDRIRILNNNSTLEMVHLNTQSNPAIISRNFGLQTPPTPAEQIRNFKIEQLNMEQGYFSTFFLPKKNSDNSIQISKLAFRGKGSVYKIFPDNETFTEIEFAVNRGSEITTANWKSDARVVFIEMENHNLNSFLLTDFTSFNYGTIEIQSSLPVTLYLERNKTQWLGYLELPNDVYKTVLDINGISAQPIRMNHQLIKKEKFVQLDIDRFQVQCDYSGSLEFGIGSERVEMPYRHHTQSNFLVWIKRKFDLGLNYNNLSDYDKQHLKNHIVRNTYYGLMTTAENLSRNFFNDPYVLNHAANATGLMQETISDMTFTTFDIPHRYQLEGIWGESEWKILEDGMFTERGIRLRNFSVQTFNAQGKGAFYQYFNYFPEHQSHSIRFQNDYQNYLYYQFAETDKNKSQHIQLQYNDDNLFINPGYVWDKINRTKQVFMNSRWNNYSASFFYYSINGYKKYNQSFSGYINNFLFAFEGEQTAKRKSYYENIGLYVTPEFYLSQSMNFSSQDMQDLFIKFNYNGKNQILRGSYTYNQQKTFQQLYYYLTGSNYYVSTGINLKDYQFSKENQLNISGGVEFNDNIRYYSNLQYKHNNYDSQYKTSINQQLTIPVDRYTFLQPVLDLLLPDSEPVNWIGSGISHFGKYPLYCQILYQNHELSNNVDYQLTLQNISIIPDSQLLIWLHIMQMGDAIQESEIRIQKLTQQWQPGIYYNYKRDFGSRLEGYLEWYW